MHTINVKVEGGSRLVGVYLHSFDRVPIRLAQANSDAGQDIKRKPGSYSVFVIEDYSSDNNNVTCTVTGANGSAKNTSAAPDNDGNLIMPLNFRIDESGVVS